jgi:hypothetical protein
LGLKSTASNTIAVWEVVAIIIVIVILALPRILRRSKDEEEEPEVSAEATQPLQPIQSVQPVNQPVIIREREVIKEVVMVRARGLCYLDADVGCV